MKTRDGFHISRKPIVRLAVDHRDTLDEPLDLAHAHGPPILFAIARDPHTIFASWSVDWHSTFEQTTPVNRQVHLRVCRADGLEEMRVIVEPMASIHYVITSALHGPHHLEIGYYQPADVWNSVAKSNEVLMPPDKIAEQTDIDLATVPLHVSFQGLFELFGAKTNGPCATELSKFQKQVLSKRQEPLTADEKQILQKLRVSVSDMAIARRTFNKGNREKLAPRSRALVSAEATSPSRGFEG